MTNEQAALIAAAAAGAVNRHTSENVATLLARAEELLSWLTGNWKFPS